MEDKKNTKEDTTTRHVLTDAKIALFVLAFPTIDPTQLQSFDPKFLDECDHYYHKGRRDIYSWSLRDGAWMQLREKNRYYLMNYVNQRELA